MVAIETNPQLGEQVREDAKRYVLHSWSVQDAVDPLPVAGAEGRYFWDYDGKRYLDFASQLVNVSIGYGHPKVVAAIKEQAEQLATIGPPMATESRSRLGRLLAEVTPGDLSMSFFTNGGTEANENAIKLARWYTGRHKIIARYRSYHGATGGTITLTGDPRRWYAEPGIPGVGRTGKWFAVDHWNVVPDILTVAKGINSGYVPLGAMVVREPIAEWVRSRYFGGGLTYSGHPLACASGVASIEAFQEEGIVENAAAMGDVFRTELGRLAEKHPAIGDVRGLGCFWGLELVKDRATREPLVPFNGTGAATKPVAALMKRALDRGLYLMTHWNIVMCCPPLTITRDELDEALDVLDDALSVADEFAA